MDKSPDAFRTISEVAELLETPAHVLRFWESRFPQIKPVKRAGGRRYYRPADVALLSGIRHLLHDEGMTIRGVQKVLRDQGVRHVSGLADEGGDDTLEDLDLAIGQAPDLEADNVVALTEWRSAAEAGETQSALREALLGPMPPPDLVADEAPMAEASADPTADAAEFDDPMVNLFRPLAAPESHTKDASPMQWSLFDLDPLPAAALPATAHSDDALSGMGLVGGSAQETGAARGPVPPVHVSALTPVPETAATETAASETAAPETLVPETTPRETPEPEALVPAEAAADMSVTSAIALAPLSASPLAEPLAEGIPPRPDMVTDIQDMTAAMPLAPAVADPAQADSAAPEVAVEIVTGQIVTGPDVTAPDVAGSVAERQDTSPPESTASPAPPAETDPHIWLPPRLRSLRQSPQDQLDLVSLRALQQRAGSLLARLVEANAPRRG